jgi:long-chain acyl-CoA synthetase
MSTVTPSARTAPDAGEAVALAAQHTITEGFAGTVAARGDAVALRGAGQTFTWSAYADAACRIAAALAELGVRPGDRVALMLRNRPEFHLADMGALLAGATPFSIYNSSAPAQIRYLLGHSEAAVAIVEDEAFLARLLGVRKELEALRTVALVDGESPSAIPFSSLLEAAPVALADAAARARPEDLATLVYTSGTTGPPKGAMTAHRNVRAIMESFRRALEMELAGARVVSYLPMAHALERDVSHYLHVLEGSEVSCCPDPTALGAALVRARPQFFAAVPRVWEKLCAAMLAHGPATHGSAAFAHALEIGERVAAARAAGIAIEDSLAAEHAALEAEILRPERSLVGLDECAAALSGGAPLPEGVHRRLLALGVPLGEGYGLTESTFIVTYEPRRVRVGTVGPPMPGLEVAVAEDGEVLTRGPHVFAGYLKAPERTAEAIDADGWLHTGDIGALDEAGYLRIVDRKKELIITAGGKNIAPANLEAALKSHPLIGQACVIGDRRPYVVALVVLDPELAPAWAAEQGIAERALGQLAADPRMRAEIDRCVAAVNADVSSAEQIKRVSILHEEWLPDSEELTPTMKLKRRGVLAKYGAVIEGLYGDRSR